MKRVIFTNGRNKILVGHLHLSPSSSIIVMCHGFTSDKSSRGRFDYLAQSFQQQGYNVLAFDFSGCGESDDDSLTLAKKVDDLKAAMMYVTSLGYNKIALFGHSLGARVCLEAFDSDLVTTMILTGAGTGPVRYNWNEHFSELQLQELQKKGYLTDAPSSGTRKSIRIEKQMLMDFEYFDQKHLLEKVTCPVLLIHGDTDWEEKMLAAITKKGMYLLSADSVLSIIPGATHSFNNHLSIVEELAGKWLLKHFPLSPL